ncbi:MAG: dihydropyrimidinase [Candidatus Promineofilum sp.]|nr:dihydropyrimidinase [Promineifilum sp.]MBP9657215.1 dihydropyrimidinase [Promineifilum sp.]
MSDNSPALPANRQGPNPMTHQPEPVPTPYDLVIKNGAVVSADEVFPADVAVSGETIAAIGRDLRGRREIDAAGKLVIPGGIDIHVHLQMPIGRFTSTDDFYHGTRAAAAGGTTAIVDFVETAPEETMLQALAARQALARDKVVIDYGLHMTIGPGDIAKLDQVAAARQAGCGSFKLYMAYGLRLTDGELLLALEAIRDAGGLPVVHAENWDVITTLIRRNLAEGRTTPHWHPRSRPAALEAEAAGRVIDIAAWVGVPLHIFHVSCEATAIRIAAAKDRGLPVTGETCPQYLYLTQDVYDRPGVEGALPVCSPPLRPAADRGALWTALQSGALDLVTTDHCPFTAAEKATGLNDYSAIPGGVPSIQSRLSLVYDGLVNRAGDDGNDVEDALCRWVDVCATTPARLLGFTNKGRLLPGYDADIVIFDPQRPQTISAQTLCETAGWTPYEGLTLRGSPVVTLSRGEVVAEGGRPTGAAGRGRFVAR